MRLNLMQQAHPAGLLSRMCSLPRTGPSAAHSFPVMHRSSMKPPAMRPSRISEPGEVLRCPLLIATPAHPWEVYKVWMTFLEAGHQSKWFCRESIAIFGFTQPGTLFISGLRLGVMQP